MQRSNPILEEIGLIETPRSQLSALGQISWGRVSRLLAKLLLPVARISAVGENLGSRDSFAPIVDVARKFFLV